MKLVCENGHLLEAGSYWCPSCKRAYTLDELSPIHDPGDYVDRWEIVERLCILPMAALYRARHRKQKVILKAALRGFDENLKREAKLLAQLPPHAALPVLITTVEGQSSAYWKVAQGSTVQYFTLFEDHSDPFLRDKLARQPQLPTQIAGWIAAGIAEGILCLQEEGRGLNVLNPEAVIIHEERSGVPRPILFDWMASSRFGVQPPLSGVVTRFTPPEFLKGQVSQPQSDVYGLGAILYELLAGKPLFGPQVQATQALKESILRRVPAPISQIRPDLNPEIAGLVSRALEKTPELRQISVEEFLSSLTRHFGELPKPKSRFVIETHWIAIILILVITACAIAIVIALTKN